jgi:hypothetical protein
MIIPILSIIFAFAFASAAKRKGYRSRRIWLYPLALGGGLYVLSFLLILAVVRLGIFQQKPLQSAYPYIVEGAAVILFFAVAAKAWRQIKALPEKNETGA